MNYDVTPEERTGARVTSLPEGYTMQPPQDPDHGMDCPYPGVGFNCWSTDGSCFKTDMVKFSSLSEGR